jgi:hypothetical protein
MATTERSMEQGQQVHYLASLGRLVAITTAHNFTGIIIKLLIVTARCRSP